MTDMSDKSPEAYAARLRQIIKQREQAVTQARKLLHPLSAEKHEQVLEIITGSAWNGELDLSEHWIFLQIFEKSCDILRAVRHEMNLELMARYRVMIWVHQASSPLEGSTAERDILKLNADEARFHLRLLEGFISNRHMMNKRQIEDLCCQISIKIEEIEKIEKIFERSMENGANAWIEYFLSLIKNERDWHASKRLPKIPEGGHSEVLKQLITLDEKYRYKDAVTADGLTGPWKSSFGDAFSVALAGELDDEAKQLFLEKQVAPIAFLGSGCINVTSCIGGRPESGWLRAFRPSSRKTTTYEQADPAAVSACSSIVRHDSFLPSGLAALPPRAVHRRLATDRCKTSLSVAAQGTMVSVPRA